MNRLIVAPYAGLMAIASYLILTATTTVVPANTYLSAVVLAPAVEETVRYFVARTMFWRASPLMAAGIGFAIGVLEIIAKLIGSGTNIGFDVRTLLTLAGFSGSIPIHIALSVSFYSIQRLRLPKMILLHGVLNLTLLAVLGRLWGNYSVPAYAAMSIAVTTAICLAIAFTALARWRAREE
jgi:hypothetical protein